MAEDRPRRVRLRNVDLDTDGAAFRLHRRVPAVGDTDGTACKTCPDGCPADPLNVRSRSCGCGAVDTEFPARDVSAASCPPPARTVDAGERRKRAPGRAPRSHRPTASTDRSDDGASKADLLLKQASQTPPVPHAASGRSSPRMRGRCSGGTFAEQRARALEAKKAAQ